MIQAVPLSALSFPGVFPESRIESYFDSSLLRCYKHLQPWVGANHPSLRESMKYWRQILRFLVSLQLLPALESGEETTLVGGQAVIEGVMMRSPHAWGIAIRKPCGEITTHSETLKRPSEKHKWMGWPFLRGLVTLGNTMRLGVAASKLSLNVGVSAM